MISKVWKVFKEVVIGILLVLSLWLVVNGALKESKGHFEFGNLMDFFNTLGTIGTLCVAYLVYKKAPEWLSQKFDEESLNHGGRLNEFIKYDLKKCIQDLINNEANFDTSKQIHTIHYHSTLIATDRDRSVKSAYSAIDSYCKNNKFIPIGHKIKELELLMDRLNLIEWYLKKDKLIKINDLLLSYDNVKKNVYKIGLKCQIITEDKRRGFFKSTTDRDLINEIGKLEPAIFKIEKDIKSELFSMIKIIEEYSKSKHFRSYFERKLAE